MHQDHSLLLKRNYIVKPLKGIISYAKTLFHLDQTLKTVFRQNLVRIRRLNTAVLSEKTTAHFRATNIFEKESHFLLHFQFLIIALYSMSLLYIFLSLFLFIHIALKKGGGLSDEIIFIYIVYHQVFH